MTFELEVGDRLRTVEIQRHVDGDHVTVDGRAHLVDAAHIGASAWSLLVRDANGNGSRSVEAAVIPRSGQSGFDVYIDGLHVPVQLKGGLGRRAREAATGGRGSGPQRVTAPMPGRIVRVLITAGDDVKARQALVVVEAMKMENELRAARDGHVREVLVTEGQSVEAGTPLVVIE
jgi:glutaconyl-CoA/methylmalonyl-CoA decarboxylase subunit gamma